MDKLSEANTEDLREELKEINEGPIAGDNQGQGIQAIQKPEESKNIGEQPGQI